MATVLRLLNYEALAHNIGVGTLKYGPFFFQVAHSCTMRE